MKTKLVLVVGGVCAASVLNASEATNNWAAIDASACSVNATTREWSTGAAGGTFSEVSTNGTAMTIQKNEVSDGKIKIATGAEGVLVYRPATTSTNDASATVTIDFTVKFVAASKQSVIGLDNVAGSGKKAQGGLAMRKNGDAYNFTGLDYASSAFVWRDLAPTVALSAAVSPETEYKVRMLRSYGETPTVRYFVKDGDAFVSLTNGTTAAFAIPSESNFLSLIGFRGTGVLGGMTSIMTVEIPGIGIIIVDENGDPVENGKVYQTVDEAIADRSYGQTMTVNQVLTENTTVTLAPGVTVKFTAGQNAGLLTIVKPAGDAAYYDLVGNATDGYRAVLNQQAKPAVADSESGAKDALVVGAESVTLNIDNVKPNLYYGIKATGSIGAFSSAEPTKWVKAGNDGKLSGTLDAAKQGDTGFYGVVVTDEPKPVGD